MDFSEREDVKELAERIKLLIPGVQDLEGYAEQGALALAQAAITSGLNPFMGEIWVLRQGRTGERCTGFSIKPGIKGARRAARNQAAEWGLIPPYYRPMFRTPSDFERKIMKAAQDAAAVACDLELLLPLDHPWYRDADGERYVVTGLGMAGGGGRMAPFQQARKRAEEDALKLAFDLPIYGGTDDMPEPEADPVTPQAPAGPSPGTDVTRSTPDLRLVEDAGGKRVVPMDKGDLGPLPDFTQCGPNFWNNLTRDLQQQGLIPSKAWLVDRFRRLGVTRVTEDNAQDLVRQALEAYAAPGTDKDGENGAESGPETPRESVNAAGKEVDAHTGEILGPARPLSPSGVVALVQGKLEELRDKWPPAERPTKKVRGIYDKIVLKLVSDEEEEAQLLFYLLFSRDVNALTRAEMGAFLAWCLEPEPTGGDYNLNEWAINEADGILEFLAQQKTQATKDLEARQAEEAERQAAVDENIANAIEIPLPEAPEEEHEETE